MSEKLKGLFTPIQWRIFIGCFFSYVCAYTTRLNLSAALPSLMEGMGLTNAQGGLLQTVFAVVYAGGQLVNGAIADRVSARKWVALGLSFSGVANILLGSCISYPLMLALWAINGAAQSMLWTPMVKLMATWFPGKARARVSFGLSASLITGHLIAWALAGWMAARYSWRMSFIVPGALTIASAGISLALLRDGSGALERRAKEVGAPLKVIFLATGLLPLLIACAANGYVRDTVMTWSPTILAAWSGGVGVSGTLFTALVIPCINFIGVLSGRVIYRLFRGGARVTVAVLLAAGAAFALLVPLAGNALVGALLMGLCCSTMYGINPLITSLTPMEYSTYGRVGLVAGLSDCAIYLGSSLSGVASGAIATAYGWNVVFICVAGVSVIGALAALRSAKTAPKVDA